MTDPEHESHETIERAERIWVGLSLVLITVFVTLVFFAVGMHGAHIGHTEPRQQPRDILSKPGFANPGVERTAPGEYTVHMVSQAFSFVPGELEFPAGSTVTFHTTSRDVIHGLLVMNTPINLELIPGDIATLTYTFERPGEYRIVCSQYCGIAHHNMLGMIRITDPDAGPAPVAEEAELPAGFAAGEQLYNTQCAACHQRGGSGIPGVFPPLDGHAAELAAAEGGRAFLVDVVLYGLSGPIEVAGNRYDTLMPGLPHLSDEDIAALLNYVLHAWGNDAELPDGYEPLSADEIAARRGLGLGPADVHASREGLQ